MIVSRFLVALALAIFLSELAMCRLWIHLRQLELLVELGDPRLEELSAQQKILGQLLSIYRCGTELIYPFIHLSFS